MNNKKIFLYEIKVTAGPEGFDVTVTELEGYDHPGCLCGRVAGIEWEVNRRSLDRYNEDELKSSRPQILIRTLSKEKIDEYVHEAKIKIVADLMDRALRLNSMANACLLNMSREDK